MNQLRRKDAKPETISKNAWIAPPYRKNPSVLKNGGGLNSMAKGKVPVANCRCGVWRHSGGVKEVGHVYLHFGYIPRVESADGIQHAAAGIAGLRDHHRCPIDDVFCRHQRKGRLSRSRALTKDQDGTQMRPRKVLTIRNAAEMNVGSGGLLSMTTLFRNV